MARLSRSAVSWLALLWTGLIIGGVPSPVLAAPADEVKALVARGQAKEAYERGRRYPDQLGEPGFDYWFGLAAIDAGHPGEGTLALERYVITYPDDRAARLELARGYFLMGDDERAKAEFDEILRTDPPAKVRENIRGYLEAIRAREKRYRKSFSFFAEAGTGYDSNANGGVANGNVNLSIGPVIVSAAGQKTDNGFLFGAAGGQLNIPIRPGWSVFVGASGDTRNYFDADAFDLRNLQGSAGVAKTGERDLLRFTGAYGNLWLDNNRFRSISTLTGEWYRQTDEKTTWNAFGQWAQLGYTGNNQPRDADLFAVGGGLRRVLGGPSQLALTASANIGQEQNRRERRDLARDLYGGRLGLTLTPYDTLSVYVAASAQGSYYMEADAFLFERRRDWFYALEAGSDKTLDKNWSFRFDVAMTRNRSNIDLYDFNRNVASVKLRYDLR